MAKRSSSVGDAVELVSGQWRLNPLAPFPITIHGGDEKVIGSLKRALDASLNGSRDPLDRAYTLYAKHHLRCVEVEAWANDVRPEFLAALDQRKATSEEYRTLLERPDATVHRRERLEATFREEAYWALQIRPSRPFSAVLDAGDEAERSLAAFDLFAEGYRTSAHAADRVRQHEEYRRDVPVHGWTIQGAPKACAYCRQFFGTHAPTYYPRIPIHIGCSCDIHPVTRW